MHILHDSTVHYFFPEYFSKITSYDSSEPSIIFEIETIIKVLRDITRLAEQQRRDGYKKYRTCLSRLLFEGGTTFCDKVFFETEVGSYTNINTQHPGYLR